MISNFYYLITLIAIIAIIFYLRKKFNEKKLTKSSLTVTLVLISIGLAY